MMMMMGAYHRTGRSGWKTIGPDGQGNIIHNDMYVAN